MKKALVIIGGGVAGLAAGCYARMNGYDTTILEMGTTPGGLCTSWSRQGYRFDGSVAGIAGSSSKSPLFRLWQEIGVIPHCTLFDGDNFGFVQLPDGRVVTIHTNIDKLESHFKSLFPKEEESIVLFTKALRDVLDMDVPFSEADGWGAVKSNVMAVMSAVVHLPVLIKYSKMTIGQFAKTFKDPGLACVFNNMVHFGGPDVPLLTLLLPLAYAHKKMAGIPQKGWLSFAQSIETRFLNLGGKIVYNEKVTRLLIAKQRVLGVITASGSQYMADSVLSTADGRFSHTQLLGMSEEEARFSLNPSDISDQPVQVNIGVDMDFSSIRGPITYVLSQAFNCAGRTHLKMTLHNKFYDTSAAPLGKSALTVFLDSDYKWWQMMAADSKQYQTEKERCAHAVMAVIEGYYPGFSDKVEVIDVSTPLTRQRYTGNWMGAMQARKPNANILKALMQGKQHYAYKGIEGFYMAGQWVEPWGGITTAAQSGRKVIQTLCKRDGKKFMTTIE